MNIVALKHEFGLKFSSKAGARVEKLARARTRGCQRQPKQRLRACLQGRVTLASGLTLAEGKKIARLYKQIFTGRVTLQPARPRACQDQTKRNKMFLYCHEINVEITSLVSKFRQNSLSHKCNCSQNVSLEIRDRLGKKTYPGTGQKGNDLVKGYVTLCVK